VHAGGKEVERVVYVCVCVCVCVCFLCQSCGQRRD
jgi:hypothetical protein